MAQPITWDDVLKRTDLIGGDLVTEENSVRFRGPLSKIEIEGHKVVFTFLWCAFLDDDEWYNWEGLIRTVSQEVQPFLVNNLLVCFSIHDLGNAMMIVPKKGTMLSSFLVKGLKVATR